MPQGFTFLKFIKVLVIFGFALVIESKIRGAVFAEQEFLSGTNLVEKLGQNFVVSKSLWDFVTFDRLVSVATERKYFLHPSIVFFKYFHWQLSVVDSSHTALDELSFKSVFVLSNSFMGEFHGLVVWALNFIPHEPLDIFTAALDIFEYVVHCLARIGCLLTRFVDECRKLLPLAPVQQINIHQIDESSAILQLFLRFIKLLIQALK